MGGANLRKLLHKTGKSCRATQTSLHTAIFVLSINIVLKPTIAVDRES